MIVVVEGPSAAGKSTWIRKYVQAAAVIEEFSAEEDAPNSVANPDEAANYWAEVSAKRWSDACEVERQVGLVVCDSDPFKLHYVWSLWRIGKVETRRWQAELKATRALFAEQRLGIGDLTLVAIPAAAVLAAQAAADTTRRRPNFPLHSQLVEPLKDWYQAIERLDPKRVIWELPQSGATDLPDVGQRDNRSGTEIFNALISELPAH